MYEELIQRLLETSMDFGEVDLVSVMMLYAANAIEELEKFYQIMADAYETEVTKERWIPVTERLPDNIDEEVLVCNEEYGKSGLGFVTVAIYDGSDWIECWKRKTCLAAVTHWMPLPEPPEEET